MIIREDAIVAEAAEKLHIEDISTNTEKKKVSDETRFAEAIGALKMQSNNNTKQLDLLTEVFNRHMESEIKQMAKLNKSLTVIYIILGILTFKMVGIESIPALLALL